MRNSWESANNGTRDLKKFLNEYRDAKRVSVDVIPASAEADTISVD